MAEEDDWRAFLRRITGETSLCAMTRTQHRRVLAQLLPKGKPHFGKVRHSAGDWMGKIRAEWLKIVTLGGVSDGSEEALAAFIARNQATLDRFEVVSKRSVLLLSARGADIKPSREPTSTVAKPCFWRRSPPHAAGGGNHCPDGCSLR